MNLTPKRKALIDFAKKFVRPKEVMLTQSKERMRMDFMQYCVREVDRQFKCQTLLFATESSQMLWLHSPKIARLDHPVPGSIMILTQYNAAGPLSTGHVGIVTDVHRGEYMAVVEGSLIADDRNDVEGVYIKTRRHFSPEGPLRTCGFLLPWAN